jgi:hypothetical protein
MATARQLELEQAFRRALKELGTGVSTEFLIAATSERTKADPGEIIKAVEILNRRPVRKGPDEGAGDVDEDPTRFCWRWEKRSRQFGAICPKTSSTNYSNTRSPLKMTRPPYGFA